MKGLQLFLNLLFAAALAVLYYLHFMGDKAAPDQSFVVAQGTHHAAETAHTGITLAWINTDSLWEQYEMVKDMKKELKEEKERAELKYKNEVEQFEKEVQQFQEKAQFMSMDDGQKRQLELMEKEQSLMKMEQDLTQRLVESETNKNKQIYEGIILYLKEYNAVPAFSYIFAVNTSGSVLLANDSSSDITATIVEGINNKYRLDKGQSPK